MRQDSKITIDEDRLRRYDAMKPAARGLLVTTARMTAKAMWHLLRFAFRLPGIVRRAASGHHAASKDHAIPTRKKG